MEHVHLLPEKVKLLRALCDLTGAKVVISSAWRMFMNDDGPFNCPFRFAMHRAGFTTSLIIGKTDDGPGSRPQQIDRWIMANKPHRWCIIDDEDFGFDEVQQERFVHTEMEAGLRWKEVWRAVAILGILENA